VHVQKKWMILLLMAAAACQRSDRPPRIVEEEYVFDDQGRQREVRLNGSRAVRFSYDGEDRLVRYSFSQGSVAYGYEPGGNLRWMKDVTGVTEYYRDESGRVAGLLWRHGPRRWVDLEHDGWGRILAVSIYNLDRDADAAGLVATEPPSSESAWQQRSRSVRAAVARWESSPPEYAVRYDRDEQGRIAAVHTPLGAVSYEWRQAGREVERTLPNGLRTTWTYDEDGRLTRVLHAASAPIAEYRYFYAGTGSLLRVEESAEGSEWVLEYRRDAQGRTCEALPEADLARPCRTDVQNRPETAGGADLQWDRNGALASRTTGGQTTSFEYDDRGLPIRAAAPGLDITFDWDGDGRLVGSRDRGAKRTYLTDPAYATGEPWLEFDAMGAVVTARFCDDAAFLEVDPAQGPRFVLRDGFHNARYVFNAAGEMLSRTGSPVTGHVFKVKDRWTTAPIASGASFAVFNSSPEALRRFLELANSARRDRLAAPEIAARAYRAQVEQEMSALLRHAPTPQVRLVLEPAGVGSLEAARDTRYAFPHRDGLFLPSAARPLGPMVFPALLSGAYAQDRPPAERVLDLPALIETAAQSGKPLESIACAAACSGELERNIPALVRYARRGRPLPAIMAQAAYVGADALRRLREAGYRTPDWPAPVLLARLRPAVRDGHRGATPVANVGAPPVFPGPAGPAPGLASAAQDRLAEIEPLSNFTDGDPEPAGEDASVPGSIQFEDPYAAMREQAEDLESTTPRDPLWQAGTLTGATYDAAKNRLVFVGDGVRTPSSVDSTDLAAALFLAFQPEPQYPRFSLDPADRLNPSGPWLKAVYYPGGLLAGTQFGRTLFEADWRMKQYSFGIAVGTDGVVRERDWLPGGLEDLFRITFRREFEGEIQDWTRLWITPGELKIRKSAKSIQFDATPMIVRAKRQVVDPSSPDGLRDDESALDPAAQEFANLFSANYEHVAAASPVFARLRELAKLVEAAQWLREIGAPVDVEWAGRMARGIPAPDRVPALSSDRSMAEVTAMRQEGDHIVRTISTHTVRLFGGVDLRMAPHVVEDGGRLREIEETAAAPNRGELRRVASVPLARPGEKPPAAPSRGRGGEVVRFGQSWGEHRFDASGRIQKSSFPDGSSAEYTRKPNQDALGIRIVRPDGAVLQRSGAESSQWTVVDPSGRRMIYRYDGRGRLSEIRAGDLNLAQYRYQNNTIEARSGEYQERITLDAGGKVAAITRSGPGIVRTRPAASTEAAIRPALAPHVDPPSLPSDAAWASNGVRTEVSAERGGGFFTSPTTAVRISTAVPGAPLTLDANASRLDARGRLADKAADRRLAAVDAPASVIVQGSPDNARAIENAYGARTRVYFGSDLTLAKANAARMPLLDSRNDVAIYLPPVSTGVEDFQIFDGLQKELAEIKFVKDDAPVPQAKVVSIAGHDSPELAAYIERMGRAGALRGKLVLLNSCHGALKADWNARIIREFGAVGIRSFTTEIDAEPLREVMFDFYQLLGVEELRGEPIERIWKLAVERAMQETDQEEFRREIRHLLEVVTQISTALHPHRGSWPAAA
jgi:YD repeat-containing protein